jgi:predicted dehydrogenase
MCVCLQVFSDHGSLLNSGMCDVVVIATPNMTHTQILLDVLAHPKAHHVLVEKPLCTTVEDCHKVPKIYTLPEISAMCRCEVNVK